MVKTLYILWIGFISGLVLNYYFKLIEWSTGDLVYTLLLNVDYFPILKDYSFPEVVEISFHMIVSFILAFVYAYLWPKWKHSFIWTVTTAVLMGLIIYPSTALSDRTPAVTDGSALLWWLSGHLIYGIIVAVLLQRRSNN